MVSERGSLLSVADAAARLGVVPSRVRALAEAGQLEGQKVGRQWVFSPADVDRWLARAKAVGRPLSAAAALGLLFELSAQPAPWLDRVSRWKVLHSQAAGDLNVLAARAVGRAKRLERRAHPSDLARIAGEPGVVRGGISAAPDHKIDLVAPGSVELYVGPKRADELQRRYALLPSGEPNVILHVADVPDALRDRATMPLGVVVVDLLESGEPRAVASARRAWKRLQPR